ncbi:hypothetical protein R1flu_003424 [Riccia fluitans]|uniref:Peroxisomal ATPase PEX1 n=1 Tax=Riccia fluitans TaxID=41844 RepID=A0ABD1Y8Z2_9MARC
MLILKKISKGLWNSGHTFRNSLILLTPRLLKNEERVVLILCHDEDVPSTSAHEDALIRVAIIVVEGLWQTGRIMEVDVRRVGLQSCFVALPPSLLELLLSGSQLPAFPVVLELKPVARSGVSTPLFVAWNGAASTSPHIEVSESLAECLGLLNGTRVRVRARSDVAEAETVVVEPATEDDWEILELNAEYLEDHILSEVGVLHEGQQFPLWVAGKVSLKLRVTSTVPQGIVKLVPGAEVVVAPKKRGLAPASEVADGESSSEETPLVSVRDAWLRVQELDSSLVQVLNLEKIKCSTTPSTTVYISLETRKSLSFEDVQLVVVSTGQAEENPPKRRIRGVPLNRGGNREQHHGKNDRVYVDDASDDEEEIPPRRAVVRLATTEGVAAGHVMVGFTLRLHIGVTIHMPIQLRAVVAHKKCSRPQSFEVSPVLFHVIEREEQAARGREDGLARGANVPLARPSVEENEEESYVYNTRQGSRSRWQGHRNLIAATTSSRDEKSAAGDDMSVLWLLRSWLEAQLILAGRSPDDREGIPVATESVIHVRVGARSQAHSREEYRRLQSASISEVLSKTSAKSRGGARNFLFLLSAKSGNETATGNQRLDSKQTSQREGQYPTYFFLNRDMLGERSMLPDDGSPEVKPDDKVVHQGRPCYLTCASGLESELSEGPALGSLSWLEAPASEALTRLKIQLSYSARNKMKLLGTPLPGFVLLHGPPACGKTQLAMALSRALEDDLEVLAHRVMLPCAELVGEQAMLIREVLYNAVLEAVHHAPSLIILDDLDALLSAGESEGPEPGIAVLSIAEYMADLMDLCQGRRDNVFSTAAVAFLGVAKAPTALPRCLCISGRLDYYIQLPSPAATDRAAILTQVLMSRGLVCSTAVATKAAASCDGADATDMELLVDRAVHAAAGRFLSAKRNKEELPGQAVVSNVSPLVGEEDSAGAVESENELQTELSILRKSKFEIVDEDFSVALEDFVPVAMRGIGKSGHQLSHVGWEDVGGLDATRAALQETLEMPVKYSRIFATAPLRLRTGVLLYGPPGCGKTHIVGAAAAACSLRLLSVKGPELLNKYIGASEQGVRDIFAKAAAASPCILFFDEFDAIAPKRGHDNTGVTDRVVNQLLTELDGVEALTGVFVFAATSRPDLLDAALLRPGRLDRLLFCDFPSLEERRSILNVLARKLPLAEDVDLHLVASLTEGFSGADLQAVLSDAQLESVHAFLDDPSYRSPIANHKPVITMAILRETLVKARPSVPEAERRRLNSVYDSFIGAKTASKSRDVKGKRATLA